MLSSFMPLVQSLIARVSMLRNESGQALVEYGLLVGLIAVLCVAAIVLLGQDISKYFTSITTAL
jgi:pilus assembly protein Flp/PilA